MSHHDPWADIRADAEHYGTLLRWVRDRNNVTQHDLCATASCLTEPVVSQIEHGTRIPDEAQSTALTDWLLQVADSDDLARFGLGQPKTVTGTSARHSDPAASHDTVRSIAGDKSMHDTIVAWADSRPPGQRWWTVTDLWEHLDRRWQRNVLARSVGLMARDGTLVEHVVPAPPNHRGRRLKRYSR